MNKLFALLLFLPVLVTAQVVPPPATQAEVTAGVNRFKYVTPYTLGNALGGGSGASGFNFGNNLFVRTNGSDSTGTRGRIDKPFLTIDAALDAAVYGDLIHVGPGTYVEGSLLRPGKHIVGDINAHIEFTDAGNGIGIFDERTSGTTAGLTNYIYWPGNITYSSDVDPFVINGAVVITNANTIVNIHIGLARTHFIDARANGAGTFVIMNCRLALLSCDYNIESDNSINDSYGALCYWENGETHLNFVRSIGDNGYGLWLKEPAGTPSADIYVTGQYLESTVGVGDPNMIAFRGSNANWKAWIKIQEVSLLGSGGYVLGMDGTGGKLYADINKLGCALGNPAILNNGGELWYTGQKVSSGDHWFKGRSNSISHISVEHWEDPFTNISTGFILEGGQHEFTGGRAKILNGRGIVHTGGTNRFNDTTIDTFGTNTSATVTNCIPIVMGSGSSNLVLRSAYLRGPIATANGGALSIWSSNSMAHILNMNSVMNSNVASVNWLMTAFVTNQVQMK